MATSGVYTLSLTLNQIVDRAFNALQIGMDGETLTGDFYNRARDHLNMLIKAWEKDGIHLWTMTEGVLFLQVGQSEYDFGDADTHLANSYFETETTAAAVLGATVLLVDDTSGFTNGNPIGVIDANGNLQWFTIVSFVANTSVQLSGAVTTAIADGAAVYTHPLASTFKPVERILDMRRRESTDYEIPVTPLSRNAFMALPNKNQQGDPIQWYYSRQQPYGILYLWNAPYSAVPLMRFTYERKLQIMVNPTDTLDLPDNWTDAAVYNLAIRLIPIYGCAPARAAELHELARSTLDQSLSYDTDLYPITINMQRR